MIYEAIHTAPPVETANPNLCQRTGTNQHTGPQTPDRRAECMKFISDVCLTTETANCSSSMMDRYCYRLSATQLKT